MNACPKESVLLIDCDAGVDDFGAIMMALSHRPTVKIVGISCVNGNARLEHVLVNVMRILKLYGLVGKIPVFGGCSEPLLPNSTARVRQSALEYHGSDGFGNLPNLEPRADPDLVNYIEEEHASNAIIRLSKEYNGKLKLIAIGPLTNLAIAVRMDPDLPSRLDGLYIMGGTLFGCGNVTPCAEFNFFVDPEAANIVLLSFSSRCLVQLVTYETCGAHALPLDWHKEWLASADTAKSKFFSKVYKISEDCEARPMHERKCVGICLYDAYIVFAALFPELILKKTQLKVGVETGGSLSRGNLIIDYNNVGSDFLTPNPITIIEELDMEMYKSMLIKMLQ